MNDLIKKTRDEIEALKKSWLKDPCWDIEKTEGFEAHHDELAEFHKNMTDQWDANHQKNEQTKRDSWYKLKLNESFKLDNYTTIRRVPGGWIYTETMCAKEASSREHDDAAWQMCQTFIPLCITPA